MGFRRIFDVIGIDDVFQIFLNGIISSRMRQRARDVVQFQSVGVVGIIAAFKQIDHAVVGGGDQVFLAAVVLRAVGGDGAVDGIAHIALIYGRFAALAVFQGIARFVCIGIGNTAVQPLYQGLTPLIGIRAAGNGEIGIGCAGNTHRVGKPHTAFLAAFAHYGSASGKRRRFGRTGYRTVRRNII